MQRGFGEEMSRAKLFVVSDYTLGRNQMVFGQDEDPVQEKKESEVLIRRQLSCCFVHV